MKKLFVVIAVLVLLGVGTGANATVVNFDDLVGGGAMPAGYAGIQWGNTWSYFDWSQPPYTPHSGSTRVTSYGYPGVDGTFTFNSPMVLEGAWFAGQSYRTVTFKMYDTSNALIATSGTLSISSVPTFLSTGYDDSVSKVEVVTGGTDGWNEHSDFVMDDLTFSQEVVPEPSSLLALVGGLGSLLALRRRRA